MRDYRAYVREQLAGLPRLRPEREAAIVEEVAQQLEAVFEDRIRAGATEAEADAAARAEVTDWKMFAENLQDAQRDVRPRWWSGLPQDLQFGLRMAMRHPAMAWVCIVTLALGIGGCTAVFSLLDAIVLRPLAYVDQDRLMMVWEHNLTRGNRENVVSPANYIEWIERGHAFASLSALGDIRGNLTGIGEPEEIDVGVVQGPFFSTLGVHPILGRDFTGEEQAPKGPLGVVLSYELWSRKFNSDGAVLGKVIRLSGRPFTVIGVLPAGFLSLGKGSDAYTAFQMNYAEVKGAPVGRFLRVVGRLRNGVRQSDAQAELSAIAQQLESERPRTNKGWGVNVVGLQEQFASPASVSLWVLTGAVLLVLLIACANVANLQFARGVQREREIAVRASLGAGRWRVIRQMLAESLVIALGGCAAGCLLAVGLVWLFREWGPLQIPRLASAGVDWRALAVSLVLAFGTALLTGLAPALVSTRRMELADAMKQGGRGIAGGRVWMLQAVVVVEVALALVLLAGAGLLLRSFQKTLAVHPGFDASNLLTMTMTLSTEKYKGDAAVTTHFRELNRRVRELPGVVAASSITFLPFTGLASATGFRVEGQPAPAPGQSPVTEVRTVQPRYFETMRIPFLSGRDFTDADTDENAPLRFVVNETMARTMFPGENALGRRLIVGMQRVNKPGEIVGVVADIKHYGLQSPAKAMVYYPQGQLTFGFGTLVVRTAGDPHLMSRAVVGLVRQMDPDQAVADVRTMEEWMSRSLATQRFTMSLLLGFAVLAVFLAVFGISSMLRFAVSQRTHEIGIRVALGARSGQIRWAVDRRGLVLTLLGAALGLGAALASAHLLRSLVFGIEAHDPVTIACATTVLILAAGLASDWPARKAAQVDPVNALRSE